MSLESFWTHNLYIFGKYPIQETCLEICFLLFSWNCVLILNRYEMSFSVISSGFFVCFSLEPQCHWPGFVTAPLRRPSRCWEGLYIVVNACWIYILRVSEYGMEKLWIGGLGLKVDNLPSCEAVYIHYNSPVNAVLSLWSLPDYPENTV